MKGQFGRLKRELKGTTTVSAPVLAPPGGQEPVVLERAALEGGAVPEFLSATFLPGRGMSLLQIKAYLPGKGEINLLDSTTLADAEQRLTGKGTDASGAESLSLGAVLELPWAGSIYGSGSASNNGALSAVWDSHTLRLPATRDNSTMEAAGGLLLKTASKSSQMNVMPDGGETTVEFEPGSFEGRWPSKIHVTTSAQLSERSFELKITARNTGDEPTPVGIGWEPRFAVVGDHRNNLVLHVPSTSRLEKTSRTGEPTGKLVSTTEADFSTRPGMQLGTTSLDDTFVNLRQASLDNGPVVELRDPGADYGLRMTLLSPTIKALHVNSPADKRFITIAPRFNYDDPFGREWGRGTDTGMVVLQPGQSTQWRVRLEIFSLSSTKF